MRQILLTSAAVLMSVSVAAVAQTSPPRSGMNQSTSPPRSGMNQSADVAANGTRTTGSARSQAPMNAASTDNARMASGEMFTSVSAQEELSSKVVGLDVYNNANQNIGKIKDIAFDESGVKAYIVAVGGFLGMGDHYVAVQPSAVTLSYDANAKKWRAAMNTDASKLKAAPEYKYSSNG